MNDLVPQSVRNFLDSIFAAPEAFVRQMKAMLSNAGTVSSHGINLSNYFSFFAYLPAEWQMLIHQILSGITLLAILFLVRSLWDMYLRYKASGKWW